MFDKFSTKQFLYIFLGLLALTLIYFLIPSSNKQSSFNTDIIEIDSSKVSSITYYKQNNDSLKVELNREGENWTVKQKNASFVAEQKSVENILAQILQIKPLRLVANNAAQWEKFEVGEQMGTRLIVKEGKKIVLDLIVGKFTVEQSSNPYSQQPDVFSHIRVADENEVFAVGGFLSMIFTEDINTYRNRSLMNIDEAKLKSVELSMGSETFKAEKTENGWIIDNEQADSVKIQNWVSEFSYLRSGNFVDNSVSLKNASWTLKLTLDDNKTEELQGFRADSTFNYFIKSSMNQQNIFSDNDLSISKAVLWPKDSLLLK